MRDRSRSLAVGPDEEALFLLEMTDPPASTGISFEEADFYHVLCQTRTFAAASLRAAAHETLSLPRHRLRLPQVRAAFRQALAGSEPPPLLQGVWSRERYLPIRERTLVLIDVIFNCGLEDS